MSLSSAGDSTTTCEGFDKLSDQMVLEILSYIPHDDYLNIRLVDRGFNRISKDASLWKKVSFQMLVFFHVDTSSS
jgi:F-box-like